MTTTALEGWRSPKWGYLGVHFLCTGPTGPRPGRSLEVVIYDTEGTVVRRLEQVKGDTIDPGYVDFFLSHRCRPSISDYHIVDTAADGTQTILATHNYAPDAQRWLKANFGTWAKENGVES